MFIKFINFFAYKFLPGPDLFYYEKLDPNQTDLGSLAQLISASRHISTHLMYIVKRKVISTVFHHENIIPPNFDRGKNSVGEKQD